MENLKENKKLKFLFIMFCLVSVMHILYASLTFRGMYEDGSFYMLQQLNNFSDNIYKVSADPTHTRFFISYLMQIPLMVFYAVFHIQNKFVLMFLYSFFQFFLPFAVLLWNILLTKRTKRYDLLFWNIFVYGAILLPFMIFSVVETLIGVTLHFILWNYLASNIDYKKRDLFFIIFLIVMMFATYEYVAVLGIIFFLAHFHYVVKEKSFKNQCVKTLIGFGSLGAAIYNIRFMLNVEGEGGEIMRFLGEATNYFPHIFELNSLLSIITVGFLICFSFKKTKIGYFSLTVISVIFTFGFIHLLNNPTASVYPMWEQHFRTVPCFVLPILFIYLGIKDMVSDKINLIKYNNFICIALICCIFQTLWQMVDTYWWDKNIQYMKSELAKTDDLLYIPSEHAEISGFHNMELRRYIWHGVFAATSILFSDTYEQKTLLVNYDEQQDPGNGNYRDWLFIPEKYYGKIYIHYSILINIKNKFWDLTDCAKALDKYNKENNIKTNG